MPGLRPEHSGTRVPRPGGPDRDLVRAYTIWPERVRKKCRTGRSLAIAHGLEDLYMGPSAGTKKRT